MNVKELEREYETVDNAMNKNLKGDDIQKHIARGIWAVALQLAKLNATAFDAPKES